MKKLALVLGVFVVLAFTTSCKKEKTCACTTSTGGLTGATVETVTKEECSSLESESTLNGVKVKVTCKEK